jgi:hypothetical protein
LLGRYPFGICRSSAIRRKLRWPMKYDQTLALHAQRATFPVCVLFSD